MEQNQKISVYKSMLTALQSGLTSIPDDMLTYKLMVDLLSKIPHLHWIGIYFYNSVTKEFYLGYNIGKTPTKTVIHLGQLNFPEHQIDAKLEIINDAQTEENEFFSPQVICEARVLLRKNGKILGMIVIGSENHNAFDEVDKEYLIGVSDTVSNKVFHR